MIETLSETGSTNADLAARLSGGEILGAEMLAGGHWLVADRQGAGRGRQGRVWFDGAGNFMGSTAVHLRPGDSPPHTLALVAGLACYEAVSTHVPPPGRVTLKWPNDLMVGAAKLGGILLERVGDWVVVGVGVNLAAAPDVPGRETVALAAFGPAPDRDVFALSLAASFAAELTRWRGAGLAPIIARWQAVGTAPGTRLRVGEPGAEPVEGRFCGLDDDGALRLTLPDGTTRVIHAGEVNLA